MLLQYEEIPVRDKSLTGFELFYQFSSFFLVQIMALAPRPDIMSTPSQIAMLLLSPVCGMASAGIVTVLVWPHSAHLTSFSPFSSVVGSFMTLTSSQLWS